MTYQESAGDQDDNATLARGLGIQCRDLVADLLEGQALLIKNCRSVYCGLEYSTARSVSFVSGKYEPSTSQ